MVGGSIKMQKNTRINRRARAMSEIDEYARTKEFIQTLQSRMKELEEKLKFTEEQHSLAEDHVKVLTLESNKRIQELEKELDFRTNALANKSTYLLSIENRVKEIEADCKNLGYEKDALFVRVTEQDKSLDEYEAENEQLNINLAAKQAAHDSIHLAWSKTDVKLANCEMEISALKSGLQKAVDLIQNFRNWFGSDGMALDLEFIKKADAWLLEHPVKADPQNIQLCPSKSIAGTHKCNREFNHPGLHGDVNGKFWTDPVKEKAK